MERQFTRNDWSGYAKCYDSLNKLRPYSQMLDDVAKELSGFTGPVLDSGCGTGNLIQRLVQTTSATIIGIDGCKEMLLQASEKHLAAKFIRADLDLRLPFKNGTFRAITCVNTLYALPRPSETLREFSRILTLDGSLVLATPKHGYENGLILKSHCGSLKPDSYWRAMHDDPKREEGLIRESARDDVVFAKELIQIARFNRAIACEKAFHFLTAAQLVDIVRKAGFSTLSIANTYAGQNYLLVAKRQNKRGNQ